MNLHEQADRDQAAWEDAMQPLYEENSKLRDLIADLAGALTDEGPDWSFDGVANLRRRIVEALPEDGRVDWLRPYVKSS